MRDKSECRVLLIGLVGVLVVAGCAPRLPGAPSGTDKQVSTNTSVERFFPVLQETVPDTSRMIEYRELRLGDFQGERPPKEFVHHTPFFGAVSCIYLRAEPDLRIFSHPAKGGEEGVEYVADLERVVFRAMVDRSCSWWNRAAEGLSPQRVLQHEQIHFALFEIAARRLNGRMLALRETRRFRAGSAERAKKGARRFIDRLMREAMQELDERNIHFDRETGGGLSWEQQQRWWRQVEGELLETAPHAAENLQIAE